MCSLISFPWRGWPPFKCSEDVNVLEDAEREGSSHVVPWKPFLMSVLLLVYVFWMFFTHASPRFCNFFHVQPWLVGIVWKFDAACIIIVAAVYSSSSRPYMWDLALSLALCAFFFSLWLVLPSKFSWLKLVAWPGAFTE